MENINYLIYIVGNGGNISDTLLGVIFREPWERPQLGQELSIKNKIFRVVKVVPPSNPSNVTVSYYVEPLNNNWPYRNNK